MISLIVAVSQNGVIGTGGKLPWHFPADLKRFKEITLSHPIIMGRKTFESIGKPLPGRTNLVITHRKNFACCGALTAGSLEEALKLCEKESEVFVIGGAQIFKHALPVADRIYLTLIHQDFEGDARFEWDRASWRETSREEFRSDSLPYAFIIYDREAR